MTEQEIKNLEMDLEECILEAIAIGASPDERFAIEIIEKKIFYYHGSAIPEKFESECFAYGVIPDVEDEDDSTITIMASEMISKALGKSTIKTHELKTWKPFFEAVISGEKTFEMRKDDRGFEVGDNLRLIEVDPDKNLEPTGRVARYKITYILRGEQWGVMPEYAILAIK